MTGSRMARETRDEIVRRLNDGAPVYRIAQDMNVWVDSVRAIRNEHGIPARRAGSNLPAKSKPVLVVDPDEDDGDPKTATPLRIPVGQWCIERPNQAQWRALIDAATGVELVALRLAMCWVLDLPLGASDEQIGITLTNERRTAEDLAGLYMKARGYGR